MNFVAREMRASDLDLCIGQLSSPWMCDPAQYPTLLSMWREIIESECGSTAIALDAQNPREVIGFGVGVFVDDRHADEYHRCRVPLISRQMLAEWSAGKRPFLSRDEVARANAGPGLNFVLATYGRRHGDPRINAANHESVRLFMQGWNLRTLTIEVFTDPKYEYRELGRSGGYNVLDYPADAVRAAGIPEEQLPFVYAASRAEHGQREQWAVSYIFNGYAPPRFGFTPLEQRILVAALDGATDITIAQGLNMSIAAIKKHFRTIYDKVGNPGVTGARRHLLNYLREHFEELRPYLNEGHPRFSLKA
jgi:DNA-binding CsgD family transcriptional regulator